MKALKILIAEDVDSNFLYLKAVLKKIDAEVIWAKTGLEAVEVVGSNSNIDLILMDMMMPEMNGYEAASIIKQSNPNIKIIAQTAFAMSDDREKTLHCGCDEYIAKPIRSGELLALIERVMAK
ncbi:MAG: response regulator [Mangrovibacterium sp.]